jgi:predicted ABC-type ATPase
MDEPFPIVVVLAGPNGAGKSTAAPRLLKNTLGVTEFVNADAIAHGLSAFNAEGAAISAGRVMLSRLKELAQQRVSFAFENTLASRSFAPWLTALKRDGYAVHVVFLWLPSANHAVQRVTDRVAMGGHNVPEKVVRRRYASGLRNFFELYQPLASAWRVFDASRRRPRRIAEGLADSGFRIDDAATWQRFQGRNQL